jgi:asparagine synthase (glutamine-hydrolysing)
MCGICGKLFFDRNHPVSTATIKLMMDSMHHRGPDDEGAFISGNVGLGHRRLSIIDLNTGKQPISNEDDTVWIVFNGEIYNYQEIHKHLLSKGHIFRTETDTEVIIHAYEEYGRDCISRLRGMFAFAIWDARKQVLLLARDRVGIKPLYYYLNDDFIIFGSEIKTLLQDPSVPRVVNLPIIDRFLTYFYVPGNETLLRNVLKLNPGCDLIVKNGTVDVRQYWDLNFSFSDRKPAFSEAKEELLNLLKETVRLHMISDVPVGFLLSGGVDSTAMLSLSKDQTDKDLSTFTIGFDGENFADERPYARLAANRFGTKHYDMTMSAQNFLEFLPKYVWYMEEPVCEPPAIALYYVSKLASEHVKVLISGEGGDEAFAGYQNYRNLVWLERLKQFMGPLNGTMGGLLKGLGYVTGLGRFEKYVPFLSVPFEQYYYSRTSNPFTFFNSRFSEFYSSDFIRVIDKGRSTEPTKQFLRNVASNDYVAKMLYTDTKTWLPDDLLIKADRITMANSVELRVPLLDHKVLEFAAGLPSSYKVHGLTTKYILKRAFDGYVPTEIIKRRKTGFPVPYESWLRTILKDFVSDVLLDQRALRRGYFSKKAVQGLIEENLKNGNYGKEIFCLISLELWHRQFIDNQFRESGGVSRK